MPTVMHGADTVIVWGCFVVEVTRDFIHLKTICERKCFMQYYRGMQILLAAGLLDIILFCNKITFKKTTTQTYINSLKSKEGCDFIDNDLVQSPDTSPTELIWDKFRPVFRNELPEY